MYYDKDLVKELYESIVNLSSVEECNELFEDLCTYKEILQMAQRLKSAELLLEGKTYAEVIEQTGISSATLSRVSRCVQAGSGGYKKVIEKRKG